MSEDEMLFWAIKKLHIKKQAIIKHTTISFKNTSYTHIKI